jgi:dipeptidyl aminopeptidase/acylaminoacyl peptidase
MTANRRFLFALIVLLLSTIACSISVNTGTPDKQATAKVYAEQTSAALASVPTNTVPTPTPTETPSPTQEPAPSVFKHPLYYLSKDGNGFTQLYRMEVDGKTTSQVVQAPAGITDYDVSLQTGAIAYVTENDLMILRPDDSTPVKILDEIPQDGSDGFYAHHTIAYPVWSHDGTKLAFYHQGLVVFLPATGEMKTFRQNQVDEGDFLIVRELYLPDQWSPDDSKLLVTITYYESGTSAVYDFNTDQVVKLTKKEQGSAMGASAWTEDSTQVYIAGYSYGGESSDMWMFDAISGAPFEFISVHNPDGHLNLAQFPHIYSGKVYFFYDLLDTYPQSEQTARMAVSSQAIPAKPEFLRLDAQYLVEVLWADDAYFALGLQRTSMDEYPYYGNLLYIPINGQPIQTILTKARMAKWGR